MMNSVFSATGFFEDWDAKSLLLFIAVFILAADYLKNRRPTNFPPGPWAFPIVGSLLKIDFNRTHESFNQFAGTYGDVFSLRLGKQWMVVLNSFEALKEALVNQAESLAERPDIPLLREIGSGLGMLFEFPYKCPSCLLLLMDIFSCAAFKELEKLRSGVVFSNGETWKQQRRFALSTLRYFGFGKKALEPIILDEFTHCAKDFSSFEGKPFDPKFIVNNVVSNIICSLVFGHRFEYSDQRFIKLIKLFEKGLQLEVSVWSQLYNSYPSLMRHVPGPHHTVQNIWKDTQDFIRVEVKKHKQNWDPSDPRDYIDCYLKEIQTNNGKTDSTFDEESLVVSVWDLFVAGSETTSTTLRWSFLYMAKYPEIQEKVQAEIDKVIGQSRQVSMDDRANLPYTDAVIHEIQRISNIVPLSLPHATKRDIQLRGYTVPKGVTVIPNLTSALFDKKEWETPFTFNPGHFLNKEGKLVKPAAFIPFSAGKRVCLGETLAKMELFLFFTSFMQQFTISMPAGVKPVMDYHFGVTLAPHQYKVCATPR